MASISEVYTSPYYWGDIKLKETIAILEQAPPSSYLFRRLKSGSVTIASLYNSKVTYFLFVLIERNSRII